MRTSTAAQAEVDSLGARICRRTRAGHGRRTPGRAAADRTSTTRSSARHSAASPSPRTRSRARWSRRSPPAAASRAPASARIVDMRSLEIEVDVNESYINRVEPGQPVDAVLDAYPDWQIPAHVITDVPTADRQKATVLVRIGFDAARPAHPARHGREGHVPREARASRRRERRAAAVLVPKTAVRQRRAAVADVCVVTRGDRVERRAVQRRRRTTATAVEVIAGPRGGRARGAVAARDAGSRGRARRMSVEAGVAMTDDIPLVRIRDVHKVLHARQRADRRAAGRQPRHPGRATSSR